MYLTRGKIFCNLSDTFETYFKKSITARVWDAVPVYAKKAFLSAHHVYFELNLNDHNTLSSISACQLLPRGMHLSQVLPSELFLRIKLHLEYVKESMADWITKDQVDNFLLAFKN